MTALAPLCQRSSFLNYDPTGCETARCTEPAHTSKAAWERICEGLQEIAGDSQVCNDAATIRHRCRAGIINAQESR